MKLEDIAKLVDWQAAEIYTTRAGKQKPVLTGIPTRRFWDEWKTRKLELKNLGISLSFEKVHKARETATGQACRSGGSYRQPRQAKAWTVTAWINPRNSALADLAGLALPIIHAEPEPATAGLPIDPVTDFLSGEIDCPF